MVYTVAFEGATTVPDGTFLTGRGQTSFGEPRRAHLSADLQNAAFNDWDLILQGRELYLRGDVVGEIVPTISPRRRPVRWPATGPGGSGRPRCELPRPPSRSTLLPRRRTRDGTPSGVAVCVGGATARSTPPSAALAAVC